MQQKHCWQATVMNWWAIFSSDPRSRAGVMPRRGRPYNFRWGPGARGTDRAGHWASASSLKWSLQDGRWRAMQAAAVFPRLSQSLQRNQPTGLWFIPNHLASVAAGPTSEIKTCSSRWSDRQCTICPIALHVTDWSLPWNEAGGVWCGVVWWALSLNFLGI